MRTAKCLRHAVHARLFAVKITDPRSRTIAFDLARGWRSVIEKDFCRIAKADGSDLRNEAAKYRRTAQLVSKEVAENLRILAREVENRADEIERLPKHGSQ